jgi:hypothetical protein
MDKLVKKNQGTKFLHSDTPTVADFCAAAMYFNAKKSIPDLYKIITLYDSLSTYYAHVDKLITEGSLTNGFANTMISDSDSELSEFIDDDRSEDEKDGILNGWMGHKHDVNASFYKNLRQKLEDNDNRQLVEAVLRMGKLNIPVAPLHTPRAGDKNLYKFKEWSKNKDADQNEQLYQGEWNSES